MNNGVSSLVVVGRARELEALARAAEGAVAGRTRVALVRGEPGIGKSSLLEEVARRAATDGFLVLRGGSSEAQGMPPYLPFIEAFGDRVRSGPLEELRADAAELAPVLATVLPEVEGRLGRAAGVIPTPAGAGAVPAA